MLAFVSRGNDYYYLSGIEYLQYDKSWKKQVKIVNAIDCVRIDKHLDNKTKRKLPTRAELIAFKKATKLLHIPFAGIEGLFIRHHMPKILPSLTTDINEALNLTATDYDFISKHFKGLQIE